MSYIRKLLNGADTHEAQELDNVVAAIERNVSLTFKQPPPAQPFAVLMAENYIGALASYSETECDLTRKIDELMEQRRQIRVGIASVTAALNCVIDDPAVPQKVRDMLAGPPPSFYVDNEPDHGGMML